MYLYFNEHKHFTINVHSEQPNVIRSKSLSIENDFNDDDLPHHKLVPLVLKDDCRFWLFHFRKFLKL